MISRRTAIVSLASLVAAPIVAGSRLKSDPCWITSTGTRSGLDARRAACARHERDRVGGDEVVAEHGRGRRRRRLVTPARPERDLRPLALRGFAATLAWEAGVQALGHPLDKEVGDREFTQVARGEGFVATWLTAVRLSTLVAVASRKAASMSRTLSPRAYARHERLGAISHLRHAVLDRAVAVATRRSVID
jgi:hypothetical protein